MLLSRLQGIYQLTGRAKCNSIGASLVFTFGVASDSDAIRNR